MRQTLIGLFFLALSLGGFVGAAYWLKVACIKFKRTGGPRKLVWRDFFRSTQVWDQSWKNCAIESVMISLLSLTLLFLGVIMLRSPDPSKQKQAAELRR